MNNARLGNRLPSHSGLDRRKSRRSGGVQARRMAEAGSAVASATVWIGGDVENDVIRMRRITSEQACGARNGRQGARSGHVIKTEEISHPPADIVVRVGHAGIDGVAVLQSIKAAARLDGRIEVRSGQRQAPGLARAIAI